MNILFQPWTKASPLTLEHELRCSIGGNVNIVDLKHEGIDWEDESQQNELKMARQIVIGLRSIAKNNRKDKNKTPCKLDND
jgi:hypothetical protein